MSTGLPDSGVEYLYRRAWEQWRDEFFEFERCEYCGGDAADHDPGVFLGHWFARCRPTTWVGPLPWEDE